MWVLVLYIYAGVLAKGDSVTLTSIPGFKTEQACKVAGIQSDSLVKDSFKTARFMCVKSGSAK